MTELRLAVSADAERLVELVRSAYRGEASRRGWASEAHLVAGDRINTAQVLDTINGPSSLILVLDDASDIEACCQLEDRGDGLVYFGTFAVSPYLQGYGVGGRLIAEAERQAILTFGANVLEITVLAQQEKLMAWYERLGFKRTGENRLFPADETLALPLRDDLYFVVLRKKLVGPHTRTPSNASGPAKSR